MFKFAIDWCFVVSVLSIPVANGPWNFLANICESGFGVLGESQSLDGTMPPCLYMDYSLPIIDDDVQAGCSSRS